MSRGSLFPLSWLIAAIVIVGLGALPAAATQAVASYEFQDTYYVVTHWHFVLPLAAIFPLMAGIYLAFDRARFRYRRALAWWHFGLTSLGACLVLAPAVFLVIGGMPQRFLEPEGLFATLNRISAVGYGMMLIGTGTFALLVVDALIRRGARE